MVRRGRLELVVGRGRRRRILILQAERQSDHVDEVHHRALDPAGSVMWMKGFREWAVHAGATCYTVPGKVGGHS